MIDVYTSRQMGKIKAFLNKTGEIELMRQIKLAKSYKNLSEECKLWFENPLTIPNKYLNAPARKYVTKSENK